jgi:tRNA A-37 threonylcarbamoyl transferase component Bud32
MNNNQHSKHHTKNGRLKFVHKDCAKGVHGKISVVKRGSDGKLIIWKQPRSGDSRHQESFRQEIKKSKYWRKFGISRVKVCWHNDKQSLLKTYIKGPTLKQMLRKEDLRFSKPNSRPVKALGELVELLIDCGHYIQDVNRQNLVFDGKKWHLIDSSAIHGKVSHSEIRQKYKKTFLRSWSKSLDSNEEMNSLKSFLNRYCH